MHEAPSARRAVTRLAPVLGLGLLGLLPGAAGAWDANTELGWLALTAPALGAWLAGSGLRGAGLGLVPLVWSLAWAACAGAAFTPWPIGIVTGFFALGVALGRRAGARAAGLALFATLTLAGLSLGFGWLPGGAALAPHAPGLAARALDLSPLVLAFDCARVDWLHAQPEVYARAGVEWFPRRPWSGNLAAPAVLVVGCLLAWFVRPARDARSA